ncbi:uncharacterized protein [Eurosta solidaginis]|uniref:uncharacterized protein n=1 Tax=Eurosta solidaginis TaxID=178769 RepID=UPI0035313F84
MLKHLIANSPLLVLIFLTSSYLVAGQGRKPGSCRTDIQQLQSVDIDDFKGIWYMHHGMTLDDPRAFRCRRMNFTYLYINADETGYRAEAFRIRNREETPIVSVGSLKFPSNCGAQFRITYWPRANPGTGEIDWLNLRYKVLFNDAELLIIYACQNFESSSEHAELVWVYTRSENPEGWLESLYMFKLRERGIDENQLYRIYHRQCRNYGTPPRPAASFPFVGF